MTCNPCGWDAEEDDIDSDVRDGLAIRPTDRLPAPTWDRPSIPWVTYHQIREARIARHAT